VGARRLGGAWLTKSLELLPAAGAATASPSAGGMIAAAGGTVGTTLAAKNGEAGCRRAGVADDAMQSMQSRPKRPITTADKRWAPRNRSQCAGKLQIRWERSPKQVHSLKIAAPFSIPTCEGRECDGFPGPGLRARFPLFRRGHVSEAKHCSNQPNQRPALGASRRNARGAGPKKDGL
jgi:hypothetical protein